MIVKCEWCGCEVTKQPIYLKRNKHMFCDRECYFKWKTLAWEYPKVEHDYTIQRRLKEAAAKRKKRKRDFRDDPVMMILPERFFKTGGMKR